MRFLNNALTEELEKAKIAVEENLRDSGYRTKITRLGRLGRIVCMAMCGVISMLLLFVQATFPVNVWLMGSYIAIPLIVVASIWGTHRKWRNSMFQKWKTAVEDAKKKYEEKFDDAKQL